MRVRKAMIHIRRKFMSDKEEIAKIKDKIFDLELKESLNSIVLIRYKNSFTEVPIKRAIELILDYLDVEYLPAPKPKPTGPRLIKKKKYQAKS